MKLPYTHKEVYRCEKEYTIGSLKVEDQEAYVLFLGDVHVGHPSFREDLFFAALRWAIDRNAMIILMGDILENANAQSVGAGWVEQVMKPEEQKTYFVNAIREKNLQKHIIGAVKGNHEERTRRKTGFDPMQTICEILELDYYNLEMFLILSRQRPNSNDTTSMAIYANHSGSGHKTSGLAVNAMQRDWGFIHNADVLAKGHDHSLAATPDEVLSINKISRRVVPKTQWLLNTGNFVGRADTYAAVKPMRPKPSGTVGLKIAFDRAGHTEIYPELIR